MLPTTKTKMANPQIISLWSWTHKFIMIMIIINIYILEIIILKFKPILTSLLNFKLYNLGSISISNKLWNKRTKINLKIKIRRKLRNNNKSRIRIYSKLTSLRLRNCRSLGSMLLILLNLKILGCAPFRQLLWHPKNSWQTSRGSIRPRFRRFWKLLKKFKIMVIIDLV